MFTLKNTTTVIALISFFIPSLLCAAASSSAAAAAASADMTQSTTPLLEKEPTAFEIDQRNVLTYKRGWNFYEGLREMYMRGTP